MPGPQRCSVEAGRSQVAEAPLDVEAAVVEEAERYGHPNPVPMCCGH